MSERNRGEPARAGTFVTRYSCTLQGWIVGWAVTTFVSAAAQTLFWDSHRGIGEWANAVFQTADAVPPGAKLTLGGLLAAGLAAAAAGRRDATAPGPIAAVAISVLTMAIALALPVGYYPAERSGGAGWIAVHLLAAAAGGLAIRLTARRCERRRQRKRR